MATSRIYQCLAERPTVSWDYMHFFFFLADIVFQWFSRVQLCDPMKYSMPGVWQIADMDRFISVDFLWNLGFWILQMLYSGSFVLLVNGLRLSLLFSLYIFFDWVRKISRERKWQPTPIFFPEKFHGQRSLVGYSPWGHKDLDITEQLVDTQRNTKFIVL